MKHVLSDAADVLVPFCLDELDLCELVALSPSCTLCESTEVAVDRTAAAATIGNDEVWASGSARKRLLWQGSVVQIRDVAILGNMLYTLNDAASRYRHRLHRRSKTSGAPCCVPEIGRL